MGSMSAASNPPRMISTMICLGQITVARSNQAVISCRACKQLGKLIGELTEVMKRIQSVEHELGEQFLGGLVDLLERMKQASRLMERACKMPWIYRVMKASMVSSQFEEVSQSLGTSLRGLLASLSSHDASMQRDLGDQLASLERQFQFAEFPLERKEMQLFNKTHKAVQQSYCGKITPQEAVRSLRRTIQSAVGAERLKAEVEDISKQLFHDMEIAREGHDGMWEHGNRQLLMAINSMDQVPPEFLCPLSLTIMTNPMILVETGVTFEKESIDIWLNDYGYRICPVTGISLKCAGDVEIVENKSLRGLIREWQRTKGQRQGCAVFDTDTFDAGEESSFLLSYSQLAESTEINVIHDSTASHTTADFVTAKSVQPMCFWDSRDPSNMFYNPEDSLEKMQAAARNGDVEALRTLSREAKMMDDSNEDGMGFLHLAASCGQDSAVRYLLSLMLDINKTTQRDCMTPLYMAAMAGHSSVVRILLENDADIARVDKNRWTPLHSAAHNGHEEVASELLHHAIKKKMRSYVDMQANDGSTSLHLAVNSSDISLVELLLQYTLDVNKTCHDGRSSLHFCVKQGRESITELLLDVGSNPNQQTEDGKTPLHVAQEENNVALGRLLIKRGADPNIQRKDGRAALHSAVVANQAAFVKMLVLEGRADIRLKMRPVGQKTHHQGKLLRSGTRLSQGESSRSLRPLQLAKDCGHKELHKFLMRKTVAGFLPSLQK